MLWGSVDSSSEPGVHEGLMVIAVQSETVLPVARRRKHVDQGSFRRQQSAPLSVGLHIGVVLFQPVNGSLRYFATSRVSQQEACGGPSEFVQSLTTCLASRNGNL